MFSRISKPLIYILIIVLLSFCRANNNSIVQIENKNIQIKFDDSLYTKVISKIGNNQIVLNDFSASEYLVIDGDEIKKFFFQERNSKQVKNALGEGEEFVITGLSKNNIQKQVTVTIYENYPTSAFFKANYKNVGTEDVKVSKWVSNKYQIKPDANESPLFWAYQGASFEDRRDWVLPLTAGFEQQNYMGMNASDYGGGTPISDIWTKEFGIAVGHVETTPKLVSIPVKMESEESGVNLSIEYEKETTLKPGESLETFETFVNVHKKDYYASLKTFRNVMSDKGLSIGEFAESTYEPVWCAWGYERNFKLSQVLGTLPMVKKLGFEWAVLDDGWQTAEGDWYLHPKKFPKGDKDMKAFVSKINDM